MRGIGPVPRPVAEPDCEVETFARDIHAVVVGQQTEIDIGMGIAKGLQPGQQPTGREGRNGSDRDHFAKVTMLEHVQRGADAAEGLGHHGYQSLPFIGQGKPARQSAEQLDPQNLLKALDLVAHGRLRDTQLQAGAGKAQVPGGCFERP